MNDNLMAKLIFVQAHTHTHYFHLPVLRVNRWALYIHFPTVQRVLTKSKSDQSDTPFLNYVDEKRIIKLRKASRSWNISYARYVFKCPNFVSIPMYVAIDNSPSMEQSSF